MSRTFADVEHRGGASIPKNKWTFFAVLRLNVSCPNDTGAWERVSPDHVLEFSREFRKYVECTGDFPLEQAFVLGCWVRMGAFSNLLPLFSNNASILGTHVYKNEVTGKYVGQILTSSGESLSQVGLPSTIEN